MAGQDLSEISVAIGELRAGQTSQREALGDIKSKLQTISDSLAKMPPNPICIAEHQILHAKLEDTNLKIKSLSAKVSGIVALGVVLVEGFLKWIGISLPTGN